MSKLVCTSGMNEGDEFPLHEGINSIGRGSSVTIYLHDRKCSHHHCSVIKKGVHYAIEDQNSRNGTFLNTKPVGSKVLEIKIGDRIRIGSTHLVLSDKAVGSRTDQLATDMAAERQEKSFHSLMEHAAADVVKQKHHRDAGSSTVTGRTPKSGFVLWIRRLLNL